MAADEKSVLLKEFTAWIAQHINGDEKGEAQIFLDRLFKGFGHAGLAEAGATCEKRVKNDTGGTSFADLVWKPRVVIEMKKRGTDLSKHYSQAFTYWTYLVPNRPRYAVLCNFDEFWVYDFETQMDIPVEKVALADLPIKYGCLNFLFPGVVAPVFGNHHEEVTREAADKLATCFNSLVKRKIDRDLAQRFILQILMAFFAEDIGLLEKYLVKRLLDECKSPEDTYDIIGGLFEAMNRKEGNPGGRYKGVAYFNGGLFAVPARVELNAEERTLLKKACEFDWSKVRPEIFGTLFEHSLGKEQRHAQGAHFTTSIDIMKIVGPTIVEPWRNAIQATQTLTEMQALAHRMQTFKVLDPACGSGNFLFIAYRELKRLEAALYARMAEKFPKSVDPKQRPLGFVTATNFYGMDVNPFAVEIAKVTMMLAHKLSIDELNVTESALPLDNLDANIVHRDALVMADGSRSVWPEVDVIVGNPPFLGVKKLKRDLSAAYMERIRDAYPEVPGMADLCVYWIRRAHDLLPFCTPADPLAGRAGFVGTQNIRSNESRVGGLDYVVTTGTLVEAVENQPWSGEAHVHVSIANWIKTQDPVLLPSKLRLWFTKPTKIEKVKGPKGTKPASNQYDLDVREVSYINSALSDKTDLKGARLLTCNTKPKRTFQGVTPGHEDFVLSEVDANALLKAEPPTADLLFPYFVGKEVLGGVTLAKRRLLDFGQRDLLEARGYPKALKLVEKQILPKRLKAMEVGAGGSEEERSHHKQFLERWWQLSYRRSDMLDAISGLKRYLACSRVTTKPIFFFITSQIRPGDALQVFAFEDDYSFGVLQSDLHVSWFLNKRSNMKSDPRYSSKNVFGTFPWPQAASAKQISEVAEAARQLQSVRSAGLAKATGGLRALYETLSLPGKNPLRDAHTVLNRAVLAAYGFSAKKDLLQQILELNEDVAARIDAGVTVDAPGIPEWFPTPALLVSKGSIGA
ncbi:MAG: class I SAM-dependent DNA methyltransferase [Variovorax paradoxus]|uniref:site-specific DNA-methyltransferase (adenine-specific) n=1 Tax=Variovorax paradoxus TaxID=34073 RepID=A0A2W5QIC4_VARPD|nr:MAG: class I SAM-dependent DNA methyltransferase [Variovorax paradoxus]